MRNYILKYNQINESNDLDNLSYNEVERLAELGLLDNDLLKIYNYVKTGSIGDLNLRDSTLTHLPSWLKVVSGDLHMSYSKIQDISKSLKIKGSIYAQHSKLKEFRRTEVFWNLLLDDCNITTLPNNLKVNGYLSIEGIQFEEIPKNLEIHDDLYIVGSNLEQFTDGELREMYDIRGSIYR